jgi:tetratricopeptide (TPR) repeat protein
MELINSSARRLASMYAHATDAAASERIRGNCQADREDWLKAAAHYKRAVQLASSAGDLESKALALAGLGRAEMEMGLLDQGTRSLTEALEIAEKKTSNDLLVAWTLYELARIYVEKERFSDAARHFQLAAKWYEAAELPGDQAVSLGRAAQCHAKLGQNDAAIRCLVRYFRIPRDQRQRSVEFDTKMFNGLIAGLKLRNKGAMASRYQAMQKELVVTSDPQPEARLLPEYRTARSELRAASWLVGSAAVTAVASVTGGEIVRTTQLGVAWTIWIFPPILYLHLRPASGGDWKQLLMWSVVVVLATSWAVLYAIRAHYRLDQMPRPLLIAIGVGFGGAISNSADLLLLGSVPDFVGVADIRVLSIGDLAIVFGLPTAIWYLLKS